MYCTRLEELHPALMPHINSNNQFLYNLKYLIMNGKVITGTNVGL